MLDCSHHYCRECGVHHGFDHEPNCSVGAYEKRMREQWLAFKAKARQPKIISL